MIAPLGFDALRRAVTAAGYRWFDRGDFNLNLVGVRSTAAVPDAFDDAICVGFRQAGAGVCFEFRATTDPGLYYLHHPLSARGTAILKPGQYPAMWRVGLHQGKYEALVQRGVCTVYRDRDRDAVHDTDQGEETGFFGINLHRAWERAPSRLVDKWSAGCQVVADPDDFALLMAVVRRAKAAGLGKSFTYTLLDEGQLTEAQ